MQSPFGKNSVFYKDLRAISEKGQYANTEVLEISLLDKLDDGSMNDGNTAGRKLLLSKVYFLVNRIGLR